MNKKNGVMAGLSLLTVLTLASPAPANDSSYTDLDLDACETWQRTRWAYR